MACVEAVEKVIEQGLRGGRLKGQKTWVKHAQERLLPSTFF